MRRTHWLKKNHQRELPRHMVFVDTESHINELSRTMQRHTLMMGSACYIRFRRKGRAEWKHEEWIDFTEADSFWEWVTSLAKPKTKLWVFAHNWNYDAGILATATIPRRLGWECLAYVNDKPPFMVELRRGGATILLVDTLNYFQSPLAQLGEALGVSKFKMPPMTASPETWRAYNRRDVEILREAMLSFRSFVEGHELGNFQRTLASQAFAAYRHKFMDNRILIESDPQVCQLERDAYMGGRSETFWIGKLDGPLYYMDVNSMYPHVMKCFPMPKVLRHHWAQGTIPLLERELAERSVIARVELDTPEPAYPIRHRKRLVWPIGRFTTTLCTPELRYALSQGHISSVGEMATYDDGPLFTGYVEYFYGLRSEYKAKGNEPFELLAKLILNSLYGKFGQNGQMWQEVGESPEIGGEIWYEQPDPELPPEKYRVRLGVKQKMEREGESENSFPGISAHVCSYARIYLWSMIQTAGRDHVYYTDTDSLIVDQAGYDNLQKMIHPTQLGALKLERTVQTAIFYGPKDYQLDEFRRTKGVRKKAQQIGPNEYLQDKFISWDYLLSQGKDGYILVEQRSKRLKRLYEKAIHDETGRVAPLEADGHIFQALQCDYCLAYRQDCEHDWEIVTEPRKMAGWVGDWFIPGGKPPRMRGTKRVTICQGCRRRALL